MAFEKGNQFWKVRGKDGRDRIIESPEQLAGLADDYFNECVQNPIIEVDYRGKELTRVELPHPRVFQKGELARFCGLSEWRLIEDLRKLSADYSQVVTRMEGIIADQKYQHAVVGMFNSNIVARDLGLTDKKDLTINAEQPLFPDTLEEEDVQTDDSDK